MTAKPVTKDEIDRICGWLKDCADTAEVEAEGECPVEMDVISLIRRLAAAAQTPEYMTAELRHREEMVNILEQQLAATRAMHLEFLHSVARASGALTQPSSRIVMAPKKNLEHANKLGGLLTMIARMRKSAEHANPLNIVAIELAQVYDIVAEVEHELRFGA